MVQCCQETCIPCQSIPASRTACATLHQHSGGLTALEVAAVSLLAALYGWHVVLMLGVNTSLRYVHYGLFVSCDQSHELNAARQ